MGKHITITDPVTKKEYTLEYSRRTAQLMEAQGFVADDADRMPLTMIPLLMQGAFLMHHRNLPMATVDEILSRVPDKEGLLEALIELYGDTYTTLTAEPEGDASKNCAWTKSW